MKMSSETLTYLTKLVCTEKYSPDRQKCQLYLHFITSSFWDSTCSILSVPAVNAIRGSGTGRTLQIDLQKLLHKSEAKYDTFDSPVCCKS